MEQKPFCGIPQNSAEIRRISWFSPKCSAEFCGTNAEFCRILHGSAELGKITFSNFLISHFKNLFFSMYFVESWTNKHSQALYCAIRQQWMNNRAWKTGILVSPIYNGCLFCVKIINVLKIQCISFKRRDMKIIVLPGQNQKIMISLNLVRLCQCLFCNFIYEEFTTLVC